MKLLIGGSPCTYWSIAQTKNRETEASGMGWELFRNYVIARDKFQPDYFLYENNKSMSPKIRAQITEMLGVEPVCINSALVSAQNRQRLYWVGHRRQDGTYERVQVEQPEDRGILLRDVLESGVCWREKAYTLRASADTKQGVPNILRHIESNGRFGYQGVAEPLKSATVLNVNPSGRGMNGAVMHTNGKSRTLTTNKGEGPKIIEPVVVRTITTRGKEACDGVAEPVGVGFRNRREDDGRLYRRFETHGEPKSNALTTVQTDSMVAEPIGTTNGGKSYSLTANYSRDPKMINDYVTHVIEKCAKSVVAEPVRVGTIEIDGKTLPVYEVRDGQITIKGKQYPIKLRDGFYIIRKLTVTECKRLQTVPEWYVFPVSDSQAYKMLGNGWTVEVIAHIMSHFDGITAEPLDVLSMYDGMACGHIALDWLGATIRKYYATEIDKYAIKTATHNFPDIVELGNAFQVRDVAWHLDGFDQQEESLNVDQMSLFV